MAWSLVGLGAVAETTTTTLTLAEPAGVADGDLLIVCIASRSTATTSATGTGWNLVQGNSNNNVVVLSKYFAKPKDCTGRRFAAGEDRDLKKALTMAVNNVRNSVYFDEQ